MVRGRGFPSRSSYRGNSGRGNSWNGSNSRGGGGYMGYSDSRSKYDRFPSGRDDYHKSYKSVRFVYKFFYEFCRSLNCITI